MVLQSIRERLTGIIAIFIFAILIIPFAFVGVNSYFTSDSVNSVARVNDIDITATDFSQSFQNYRRRMQSLLGANFDPEQFDQPVIRRQFLDSMIDRELLSQVSVETGLSVDDASLAKAIREIPAFQVDGEFNTDVYQARLQAQGSNPQRFENEMRAQMVLDQFPGTISSSSIATDWELRQFVRLQDQVRGFNAVVVRAEPLPVTPIDNQMESPEAEGDKLAEANVNDAVLPESDANAVSDAAEEAVDESAAVAWYEAHPQDYRSEEQVVLEYVELDASKLPEDAAPDEDQLRIRFEEQKLRFITPEARLASHILIQVDPQADEAAIETARQLAQELATRARDGEDFATLAKESSQDAGSASLGGDLDWVEPGFMVKAFEDGLYALNLEHPVSDPVQTGFGWHVIELRDIRPAEGMTFEEAREVLLAEYRAEAQERKFIEQADRLVDLIYEDPTTLGAAAEVLGLEVRETEPFGRSGGTGLAANPAVVNAAFSELVLQQGIASDPIDLGENHLVMIRVKQHFPEALQPLEQVRDRVVASVRQERAMQQASERAGVVLAEVEAGADIAAIPLTAGSELITQEAARRNSPDVPAELLRQVFLAQPPVDSTPRVFKVQLKEGYAVVQLISVVDGEESEDQLVQAQNYRRRIANAAANSESLGFLRLLRNQSTVEVFEDRL